MTYINVSYVMIKQFTLNREREEGNGVDGDENRRLGA